MRVNYHHDHYNHPQVDVEGIVVENLARRCGGFLKGLSLNGCQVRDISIVIIIIITIIIIMMMMTMTYMGICLCVSPYCILPYMWEC